MCQLQVYSSLLIAGMPAIDGIAWKEGAFCFGWACLEGEILSSVGLIAFEISHCRFAEAVSFHDTSHMGSALEGREGGCELVKLLQVVFQSAQKFVQQGVFGGFNWDVCDYSRAFCTIFLWLCSDMSSGKYYSMLLSAQLCTTPRAVGSYSFIFTSSPTR